ncbi:MAG: hypothetical protein ABIH58_01770 [Patescibacteria group bacterium]
MKNKFPIKERLLLLFRFFGIAFGIVTVFLLILLFPVLSRGIAPPCIVPTSYHIARMHWIEKRGDMGWNGEIEDAVTHLHQCRSDTENLVKQLLSNDSGTVVSLGMDIIVREALDNGDTLLRQYHDDKRWNHNLAFNNDYSRLMLAMWKLKRNLPLTSRDMEAMSDWPIEYFEDLSVKPPEGSYWIP